MMADPAGPLRGAARFGRLVAMGLAERREALAHLGRAARAAAPGRDAWGMRARLAHALDDAAGEAARLRWRARWEVRDALAPLLERHAGRAALLAAGCAAAGPLVTAAEARALVETAVRRRLAHTPAQPWGRRA